MPQNIDGLQQIFHYVHDLIYFFRLKFMATMSGGVASVERSCKDFTMLLAHEATATKGFKFLFKCASVTNFINYCRVNERSRTHYCQPKAARVQCVINFEK